MGVQQRLVGRSVVTSKGQTTIPKSLRDAVGIKDGTPLTWILENGAIRVVAKTLNAADLAGFLGPPPSGVHLTIEEMDEAIAEAVVERFERATKR
ncbi:AbrB/MazE/SpoVT family DNA-binding domain-containing protein [Devosia sp. BK]|uniref:AbrB/MazE/SpoVT family DNA-binding domain-containing protein n=1 Tax=Devosia sp. BK TaxID=2871706 RepID=UPI00293B694A|nr:AbrB/MazE/SpoVT family DNA-binding domain-containing protein [Devosia sp. BK]MDV3252961.1 AbrB/MazE/SpoVT family DNA-binding domain-containing protein [Devosia sp. BK]